MKNNFKFNPKALILIGIIFIASLSRLIPHIPNFSPLGAISLFGAAFFKEKWKAILVPISATWVSDLFINNIIYSHYNLNFVWFYQGFHWVILSYIFIIFLGRFLLKNSLSIFRLGLGALFSGVIFFIISNFGVWMSGVMYSKDFAGMISCYLAGIPFFKGTILGNFFYVPVLFGTYYLLQKRFKILRNTKIIFS